MRVSQKISHVKFSPYCHDLIPALALSVVSFICEPYFILTFEPPINIRRNKTYMSEAQRSALNALLFRTGDQSKDIVLALATNRPGDLDSAVSDRIDEVLEFPLPGEDERFKLLNLYLDKYIVQAGARKPGLFGNLFKRQQKRIDIQGLNDDIIKEAAAKTTGFSGREIAKLMASVQAAVYGSLKCVLDPTLFREVVDYKVAEHQQRKKLAGN